MRYGAWILAATIVFTGVARAEPGASPDAKGGPASGAKPDPSTPGSAPLPFGSGLEADELLANMLTMIRSHYQERIRGLEKEPVLADQVRAELIQAEFRIAAARLLVRAERFEDAASELRGFLRATPGPLPEPSKVAVAPQGQEKQGAPRAGPSEDYENWTRVPVGVSVAGAGFFRVRSPTGEEAYSRSGRLALDKNNNLLFQSGTIDDMNEFLPLIPAMVIDKPLHRLIVNRDGSIQIKSPDGTTPYAGQIELAVFPHGEDDLVPDGNGVLYRAPTGAAPEYYTPGPGSPAGSVVHGAPK